MALAIGADMDSRGTGRRTSNSLTAGGAAFIIGKKRIIAEIEATYSYTTDTSDFWRREGQQYPKHGGTSRVNQVISNTF